MKKLAILGIVALVLAMGVAVVAPVSADPAILHVDDDGVQWPGAYTTISAALAVPPVAGDTIIVHQGTYTENVVVSVSVTIERADGEPMPVVNAGAGYGFTVTADDVTITGFTVIGQSGSQVGISLNDVSGANIEKNDISAFSTGIELLSSDHNTIAHNTVHDVSWAGIMLYEAGNTYNTITHNTIGPSGHDGIVIWHEGAVLESPPGWWIGPTLNGQIYRQYPIDAKGNVVMHNQVSESINWNIAIGFVEGTAADRIVVAHNEVSGPAGTGQGIMATGMSRYVSIHHNTITDVRQAILIWGEDNTVFKNDISLNGTGWDVGVNVKEHWWIFCDQSSDNFIHHNMVTNWANPDNFVYYDQNDPGENRWLKNDAVGTGWDDPFDGTSWD